MIIDNAAVRADRHIHARPFIVFIPCLADFDQRRRLPAANPLCFTSDADGTAADADLYEIGARLRKEQESFAIHHIACADLHTIAVLFTDPLNGHLLPFRKPFRRINTEHIRPRIDKERHTLRIVAGIDTGAHDKTLLRIQHFIWILTMRIVVLTENETVKASIFIQNRKGIDLIIPDNIIGFGKCDAEPGSDQLFKRRHKIGNLLAAVHTAHTVITARYDPHQFPVRCTVLCNRHGRMPRLCLQRKDIRQRIHRSQIGITEYEPRLLCLYTGHHRRLILWRLRAVNKRNTAVTRQFYLQPFNGNRLHDGGHHGNRQLNSGLLSFFELHQRRLKRNIRRNTFT